MYDRLNICTSSDRRKAWLHAAYVGCFHVHKLCFLYIVFSHVNAQFWMARIPPFGAEVMFKSDITQCESCLGITPTLTFIMIWLKTLWAFTHEDTVIHSRNWLQDTLHDQGSYKKRFHMSQWSAGPVSGLSQNVGPSWKTAPSSLLRLKLRPQNFSSYFHSLQQCSCKIIKIY